jgi:hypothetical protein
MTEPRDSDSEMPTFPFPRPDERALDALLAGTCQPEEAPADLRAVAEVFAALRAPSHRREVAGWSEALIAYRGMTGLPEAPSRSRRRQRIAAPLSTRLAAAAGVAVVAVLGGGVTAAYTGHLPATLQTVAHNMIAAPAVHQARAVATPHGTVRPVGPPATGSPAYGLCNAYQHAQEHGNAGQKSVAFRNLANAAGGADHVAAYCAAVQHPGPGRPSASPPGRRVGQPGSPGHSNHHHRNKPITPPGNKEHGGGSESRG